MIVGITSGALAAPKQHNTNPAWSVYDSRGVFIGADPDGRVRSEILRDHGTTE